MVLNMYDHKQHFRTVFTRYINTKGFSMIEKVAYIKKLLRDKEYSQKLLYTKANNRTIEIDVLNEMLGEATNGM